MESPNQTRKISTCVSLNRATFSCRSAPDPGKAQKLRTQLSRMGSTTVKVNTIPAVAKNETTN